eukprot:94587-Pyramimonas_sp.AAC.1
MFLHVKFRVPTWRHIHEQKQQRIQWNRDGMMEAFHGSPIIDEYILAVEARLEEEEEVLTSFAGKKLPDSYSSQLEGIMIEEAE